MSHRRYLRSTVPLRTLPRVNQNIERPETRDHLIHQTLSVLAARNLRGQRGKTRATEIGLLYFARCTGDGGAGIQKRLGHIFSQRSVSAGYQYDFVFHRLLHFHRYEIPVPAKSGRGKEAPLLTRKTCNFACCQASDGKETIPDAFGKEKEINK